MSRKAAVIEEFDDDTDLPLPNVPLPNTGARGPILQSLDDDSDDDDFEPTSHAGPASPLRQPPFSQQQHSTVGPDGVNRVSDTTPYKSWSCIYPIYIDAKRPCGRGQRRVPRPKAVWWPLSKDIADAANNLGLSTLHEVSKAHPRDWENPGRVRVQWKKEGKLVNPAIKTKKQLLEMVCYQLQILKPENIPKPPYNLGTLLIGAPLNQTTSESAPASAPSATSSGPTAQQKGKAPASKPKTGTVPVTPSHQQTSGGSGAKTKSTKRQLPIPPDPLPSVLTRLSPYSPLLASNVLVETVKAGMNSQADAGGPGGPGAGVPPGGMAKGKRKVVRVRQ